MTHLQLTVVSVAVGVTVVVVGMRTQHGTCQGTR